MRAIITGASSGIGRAIALELGRRGWTLALIARRENLLEELAAQLKDSVAVRCDVSSPDALVAAVRTAEEKSGGTFDLAIANAGIGLRNPPKHFSVADAAMTVNVNFTSMLALFGAVIPGMIERRSGHFAGIASLAGLRGIPGVAVYSATKAAMQTFLEASRIEVKRYGVGITVVNPGFVETPMISGFERKPPFTVDVDDAARIIADGLERRRRTIEFPLPMSLGMRAARALPAFAWEALAGMGMKGRKKSS